MKETFEENLSAAQKEEIANQKAYEELKAAKAQLIEKDLALGQERLATAEKELQLNRVVDELRTKLTEADLRLADLDKIEEINSTPTINFAEPAPPLVREVTESADVIKVVKEKDMENKKNAKGESKAVKTTAKKTAKATTATKGKPKTVKVTKSAKGAKKTPAKKAAAKKKAVKGETSATAKKTAAKKAATKKAVKGETSATASKPAAKKKAGAKKTKTAKKREDSWSTFSTSTLNRKTIVQLTEYLNTKGVPTTDDNGKALKKKLLVEAVQAL